MALTATIHHFTIRLSDVDRGVYETLELKAAKHPSESDEYLVTRVLAYCLEYAEGIAFSRGLSEPDEPPLAVRDLTGALKAWIEIGSPDAARLHRAAKAAPRVAVYTHKDPAQLLRSLDGERIHRAETLELYSLGRELVANLAKRLARRNDLDLSVTDRHLYVTIGGETLSGEVERLQPDVAKHLADVSADPIGNRPAEMAKWNVWSPHEREANPGSLSEKKPAPGLGAGR
jgi:uncharacterized protein YaeQ